MLVHSSMDDSALSLQLSLIRLNFGLLVIESEDSERCLKLFKRGKKDFQRRYVTIDETWIYHYTLETKRSSSE